MKESNGRKSKRVIRTYRHESGFLVKVYAPAYADESVTGKYNALSKDAVETAKDQE